MTLSTEKKLFLIGLGLHIVYNLVMMLTPTKLSHFFQRDTGQLTAVLADYAYDSRSYIEPADNFIEHGVFGVGKVIDYHRTIGYPSMIYMSKVAFGSYWYFGLAIVQTVLSALIYPLSFLIGCILFPNRDKLIFAAVLLMMGGGYMTKSLFVLSDMVFGIFFLLGVYLSLLSVARPSARLLIIPSILLLTFSGLIRPAIMLYPLAHAVLLISIARKYSTWDFVKTKIAVWGSALILMVACNYSAFRVYQSYKVFTPTDVLGVNMFEYSAKKILAKKGLQDDYARQDALINAQPDWIEKDKIRRKVFFETVKKYPAAAVAYWAEAATSHLLEPHWLDVGTAYGYYKKDVYKGERLWVRKSTVVAIGFYILCTVHVLLLMGFILFLTERAFIHKDFLFAIALIFVVGTMLGPSFLAAAGARIRLSVEPFLYIPAICYIYDRIGRYIPPAFLRFSWK